MHNAIVGTIISLIASTALADAKEDILAAAKKLADGGNYSWSTAAEGGMGVAGAEGKIVGDLIELHLGLRGGEVEAFLRGEKGVFRTAQGEWRIIGEDADEPGPAEILANMIKTYQPPAGQALHLAGQAQDLKSTDDGGFAGTLSADDAKALILRRALRRAGSDVRNPSGTVKFWLENGALTRFEFNVKATMNIEGEERDINRTTTVEIKDVGSTKIDLPEGAKAKME